MKNILIVIVVVYFCISCTNKTKESKKAYPLSFEKDTIFFPTIVKGDTINIEFKFLCKSDTPIKITDVMASCGCTTPVYDSNHIYQKDEEGIISVKFITNQDSENVKKHLIVKTNSNPKLHVLYIMGSIQ